MKKIGILICIVTIFVIGFYVGKNYIKTELKNEYYTTINELRNENNTLKNNNENIMKTNEKLNIELGNFQRQINNYDTNE